ncbi:hypothetical protein [Streptomyces sp. NPDC101178]
MTRHGPLNEFCWMDLKTHECGRPRARLRSPQGPTFRIHPLGL